MKTFTDRDMRVQVEATLQGWTGQFDVEAFLSALQARYGTVDVDTIPSIEYYALLKQYARPFEPPALPAPGPIWTNGTAPAADRPDHPRWCDRMHPGANATTRHRLEVLTMVVQDREMLEDVPMTVALERTDDADGPGDTRIVLTIGHALYQPTDVVLDDHATARLTAALMTAHDLKKTA